MKSFKKVVGFCLLFFACLFLISCGGKVKTEQLRCSKQLTNADGLLTTMSTVSDFEDDKLATITLKWSARYDKNTYTEDEIQTLANDTALSYKKTYGDNKNIKISSVKTGDYEYTVNLVVEYNKLTDEEKQKYGFDFDGDLESSKADFEKSEYTCK